MKSLSLNDSQNGKQNNNGSQSNPPTNQGKATSSGTDWLMLVTCFSFTAALAIWFAFDHSLPFWDAAEHLKNNFQYADLFRHPTIFKSSWWHEFLSVNYQYPITVHAFNGLLKAIFGPSLFVDSLAIIVYSLILNFSIYRSTVLISESKVAAALAVLTINTYPMVNAYSHVSMLDFPQLSLFSLAICALINWQKTPTWKNTVLLGLALSTGVTTKQTSAYFLVGPCIAMVLQLLVTRNWSKLVKLVTAGAMTTCGLLIWLIPNYAKIQEWLQANSQLAKSNVMDNFQHNMAVYLDALPESLSILLFAVFICSLPFVRVQAYKYLAIPAIASICGFFLMSYTSYNLPEMRYLICVLVLPAIISAIGISKLLEAKSKIWKYAGVAVIALALGQFVIGNFTPYPINTQNLPAQAKALCTQIASPDNFSKFYIQGLSPTPASHDMGQVWVIETIKKAENNRPCWLNVMPNTKDINVHTLEFVSRYKRATVLPSTYRLWTLKGDGFNDSIATAKHFDWFVLKTGDQGIKFDSKESQENYEKLESFIQDGSDAGLYKLYGTFEAFGGDRLMLYRKK
jgi:hypothetical protein